MVEMIEFGETAKLLGSVAIIGDKINLPILQLILLFSEFALHLLQLHGVLLNRLRLLINLLLKRARNLHHFLVMLTNSLSGAIDIFLKII